MLLFKIVEQFHCQMSLAIILRCQILSYHLPFLKLSEFIQLRTKILKTLIILKITVYTQKMLIKIHILFKPYVQDLQPICFKHSLVMHLNVSLIEKLLSAILRNIMRLSSQQRILKRRGILILPLRLDLYLLIQTYVNWRLYELPLRPF